MKVIDGQYEENNGSDYFTDNYLAPEVFMRGKYGREADVWSMGVIFLEILIGKKINQMRKERLIDDRPPGLVKGFFEKFQAMIPNDLQRILMGRMLNE